MVFFIGSIHNFSLQIAKHLDTKARCYLDILVRHLCITIVLDNTLYKNRPTYYYVCNIIYPFSILSLCGIYIFVVRVEHSSKRDFFCQFRVIIICVLYRKKYDIWRTYYYYHFIRSINFIIQANWDISLYGIVFNPYSMMYEMV